MAVAEDLIGVTFLGPLSGTDGAYHMAIFYATEDALGNITYNGVIEFGPQNPIGSFSLVAAAAEATKEYFANVAGQNVNDGSPFGLLLGGERDWDANPDALDSIRDYQILITGADLSTQWNTMVNYARTVNEEGYEYRPLQQNSNTFVESALLLAGIPEPTAPGSQYATAINPQTHTTEQVWVPAAQNLVHDPVGNPEPPTPIELSPYQFANLNPTTTVITPDPAAGVTVQWNGQDVTITLPGYSPDTIPDTTGAVTGVSGNLVLIGTASGSTFDANGSGALMVGGPGNDTFLLGYGGNDWIDGGGGTNTADYSQSSDSYTVTIGAADGVVGGPQHDKVLQVADNATGGTDDLSAIQNVDFVNPGNTVLVQSLGNGSAPSDLTTIDLGADSGGDDTVDFSQYGSNVYLGATDTQSGPAVELYADNAFTKALGYAFSNFNTLILGNGNNDVETNIVNLNIVLGTGLNLVKHAGQGTTIDESKGGNDNVVVSDDILITGSTPTDEIFSPGGILLRGAVGQLGSQDPWIVGPDGTRYGLNQEGDLVIEDQLGDKTYVANYVGGPTVAYSQQTDGIFVGLEQVYAKRLLDLTRPEINNVQTMFKLGNELLYVRIGQTFFNNDPLVFDLTGGGINLTPMTDASPTFDMLGTGFAVNTGWIGANNGILVLEQQGQDGTPTITEMFGGTGANGFAALAQYDLNGDGVIDAGDPIYSQLRIWVDGNGNGVVDPGELETLQQAGIASINLDATPQTNDTDSGNTITATGSFTFADGSIGNIDQVNFNVDTFHSDYLGDTTVSAAAAALPNLKGYGTLTDLQVAMTLDPSLIDVVNANLPNLNFLDLASLRAAAMPILVAWAEAVQLPDANGNLQTVDPAAGNSDVWVLINTDSDGNITVDDYAYGVTDSDGSYIALASGGTVYDGDGNSISRPTLDQILESPTATGDSWVDFTADEIGFMSRYYGQPFQINSILSTDPLETLSTMSDFIGGALTTIDLDAIRLAMQGPLAQYFPGIAYDPVADKFSTTTDAQLAPMYEAIFNAAPSDPAAATAWLQEWTPIINAVLGDLNRPNNVVVTYGYQFASMVGAYQASNLPLDIADVATALGIPSGEVIEGSGATLTGPDQSSIYFVNSDGQTVTAGLGLNNFVMGADAGQVTIVDHEPWPNPADESILYVNADSTHVTATRNGLDLILAVNGTNEQITIQNEFFGVELGLNGTDIEDNWGVAQIQFADGVLWDMPDMAWAVSRPQPNDSIVTGTPGMDVLDGGVGGNNYLSGGDGSDTYLFGLAYGHDTINVDRTHAFDQDTDYVKFGAGISFSDLTFARQGDSDNLLITVDSTGDSLTILNQFSADYGLFGALWLDRIEVFAFADGSTYSWDDVIRMMDAQNKAPAIYGFDYDDTLDPGAGVHFVSGENGNDTYVFDFGYALDTVFDNTNNPIGGMTNTIQFGADVTEQDVTFSLAGSSNNLIITLPDGSTMLVEGQFALEAGLDAFDLITNFVFADGTTLAYTQVLQQLISAEESQANGVIYGSDYADVLDPGPSGGNHYLSGGNSGDGNNTYVFGHDYGHETVDVNYTSLGERDGDVINFTADVAPDQVEWSAVGQDLVIKLVGSNDSLTVLDQFAPWFEEDGATSFAFADGTTLSLAQLASLVFDGSGGGATTNISNELNLRLGPATFQSGPGDVFIGSGAGPFTTAGNTFDFNPDDGFNVIVDPEASGIADTISFGAEIAPDMVQTYLLGTNMVFTFAGSNDEIAWMDNGGYTPNGNVFDAIGSVMFADGTTWSTADLISNAAVAPVLSIMQNGQPATPINGGGSYEVDYNINQGYAYVDLPNEQSGTTLTLRISGIDPANVDIQRVGFLDATTNADAASILISAAGSTADGLLIEGPQYATDLQFDQIVFDDGTIWTKAQVEQMLINQASASTGNTEIDGFAGNDTIYAGAGDDVLAGGTGNDTYVYQRGDGFAEIVVNKPAASGYVDTLQFTDIASTDVTLERWPGNGINSLVITANGENGAPQSQVTIENQFSYGATAANAAINQIEFSDGVTWTEQDIEAVLLAQEEAETGPNVTIYGFGDGGTLSAIAGVSSLVGGGTGADSFAWTAEDGATWISGEGGSDNPNSQTDTLFIHGIDPSTVTVTRDPTPGANSLILTSPGQSPIVLEGQTASDGKNVIDRVVFDDGTAWDYIQLLVQADGGIATAPNGTTARSFAGAAANTTMNGTSSDDVYFWGAGDGNDTIVESNSANNANPWQKADTVSLVGLNPGDVTLNIVENGSRDLIITDKATGETLTAVGQFSSASNDGSNSSPGAGAGIELLQFADGTIWEPEQILDNSAYIAAPGATTLSNLDLGGGTIPMQITPGVQTIYGSQHIDNTYIWSPGDGSDTIYYGGYGGVDTLRLSGVAESDIQLIRSGNTLIVSDTASGESITLPFIFPDQTTDGIGQIVFDDGTLWNSAYINANAEIYGGTGNNTIYGPSDPVIFNMLSNGNDVVNGGGAGDTFLDGPQSGNDTFNETGVSGATNTLRLIGVSTSDVRLDRSGNNLYVERLDSGESVQVVNQFSTQITDPGVEQIVFDDGTVWNQSYIASHAEIYGTAGDDMLYGVGVAETFDGLGGNDTYTDHTGVSDTFVYASSYGNDVIDYQVSNSSEVGTLDLTDIDPSGVTLTKNGNDLYISVIATGKLIKDANHFASSLDGIDQIVFADGTVWDRATIDSNAQPPLTGGPGDYLLNRGSGQVSVFASTITGTIRVPSGVPASDIIFQADNVGDLTVELRDSGDSVTLIGDLSQTWWGGVSSAVSTITFTDGSTMTIGEPAYQQGQPLTFTWIGTASDTTLTGSNYGANVFDLGPGGDAVTGGNTSLHGSGVNTIMFDKGDGHAQVNLNSGNGFLDTAADIADNDIILQADSNGDLTVALRDDTSDSITFTGDLQHAWYGVSSAMQQITFADGTTMAVGQPAYQQGQPLTFTWLGSALDTTLTGSDYGGDVFDLGAGGDTVTFGNNSEGGSGNNTILFDKGDGNAHVSVNGSIGVMQMAADIADDDVILQADNSGDLTVALLDDSVDSVTIAGDLQHNWYGVSSALQQIIFADGTSIAVGEPTSGQGQPLTFTWIGSSSDTTLTGSDYGSNVFDLGAGSDTVTFGNNSDGGSGNNTILFDKGDGNAQVSLNGGTGTVQMASDIAESDIYLQTDSAGDLIIMLRDSTSDSITVKNDLTQNWWGTSSQVSQISFTDGSTLAIGQPNYNTNPPPTFTWIGSGSSETLTGSNLGNNTFDDGGGNDVLNGGGGYDTYKFGATFGQTVINNYASDHDGSAYGEIDFASGVAADQLWFQQSGNNLKIDLLGTNDSITVNNWYASDQRNQVESVHSGDGQIIDAQLQQLVGAMATYAANNPGFNPTQVSQMPTDTSLQSALAAAWHH